MKGWHSLKSDSSIDDNIGDGDVMDDEMMMMMTTLPRTLCGHLPNKAAVEVQQKEQRAIVLQLEYLQRSPTGPTVQGDTRAPAR